MIKRRSVKGTNQVKISFVLPEDHPNLPATVVGDFNGWDNEATPLQKRSNKTYSAVVTLEKDRRYLFRYRAEDGSWFNEEDSDAFEPNDFSSENCVLLT
ncbi:MAG: isoamylase early set domain-containing protein [Anaerolineae bacterium]|nr:isoamylase early set domain-containing protein [Anaerolineae bacterium]